MELFERYGPFFTVAVHSREPAAPWRPVAQLADSSATEDRIRAVQRALGSTARVATSVAQLSLVARLASPALAASVRLGQPVSLAGWYWQPPLTTPFALSMPADPAPGALVDGSIRELAENLPGLPKRVGWGNVASALNTAALLLGPAGYSFAELALAAIPTEPGPIGPGFRRGSCCLLYQAGRPLCGDCVLA